ncbi:MAG: glycosyltransferase family 8 protein [Clostridia bacterium]|nr:glycosyltransferase family 8 protein [Clostridia bacterium]
MEKINILVTLDENYIKYMNVMITSLLESNQGCAFDIYLLHTDIPDVALNETRNILKAGGNLIPIKAENIGLDDAPTTARYPKEMYYRIFAAKYLPDTLDRVLYLDPDLIVNGELGSLYHLPMDQYYFAAASHTGQIMTMVNSLRLDMDDESPYINSGVMLINLELLRKEQRYKDVFEFIKKRKNFLILPDQDIISGLYGSKILALDTFKYNMTENLYMTHAPFEKNMNIDWVRKNSVIIHYCGRNKPWKPNYIGQLDIFYKETVSRMQSNQKDFKVNTTRK